MINLAIAILNLRTGVCNNIIPYFRRADRLERIIAILISTNSRDVGRRRMGDIDPGHASHYSKSHFQ